MKMKNDIESKRFAKKLVAWRKRIGREKGLGRPISQAEAAEIIGMSKRTLQNWEIMRFTPVGISKTAVLSIIEAKPAKT